MKKNYTHISILLDKSGSMETIKNDVIGGFNAFIEAQKKEPGELTITLAQFSTDYQIIYQNAAIENIKPLTKESFFPSGGTALLQYATRLINDTGTTLAMIPENYRPEKVLFVMITDGEENSSGRDFSKETLKELTEHQKTKYNWQFMYIGANQDSFSTANSFGISGVNYMADTQGTGKMFAAFSNSTALYRSSVNKDAVFNLSQDDINTVDEEKFLKKK